MTTPFLGRFATQSGTTLPHFDHQCVCLFPYTLIIPHTYTLMIVDNCA